MSPYGPKADHLGATVCSCASIAFSIYHGCAVRSLMFIVVGIMRPISARYEAICNTAAERR